MDVSIKEVLSGRKTECKMTGPSLKGKYERRWIPGYEDLYAADVMGVIWSYWKSLMGMPLKSCLRVHEKAGNRCEVNLQGENGKRITCVVAHLILKTFVGPRPSRLECCHYDDNPENNALENLRWDTTRANQLDSLRNRKRSTQKLSVDNIREIRKLLSGGEMHKVIAIKYGVARSTISQINVGSRWGHIV